MKRFVHISLPFLIIWIIGTLLLIVGLTNTITANDRLFVKYEKLLEKTTVRHTQTHGMANGVDHQSRMLPKK